MSEENRKKLELALKLKQALETDLKRLGKYVPKEKKERRTRYVPQSREKPVTLNFSNIKNLRDVDEQDYDAPDTDLVFAIKKAISSANLESRMTLQVILNLIEGTCSEVTRQLEGVKDPKLLYNLWECQLFEGKASIATAFGLVKEFAAHPFTLLYLAEVLFFGYEAPRLAEKVLQVLSEITNDPRLGFLLATYHGERDKAAEHLAELMRTSRFKDAIPIYLLLHSAGYDDETRVETLRKHVGEKKHSACAMAALVTERAIRGEFKLQHLRQLVEKFPYCKLINNVLAQGEAVCGENFDLTNVDEPTRLKFQIAMAVNEGHHETVKELTSKLADMFGGFQLVVGLRNEKVERKGMPSREELKQVAKINLNTGVDILQVLQRFAKERDEDFSKMDYMLETPNIEFLRLVWGWRVCQKLY